MNSPFLWNPIAANNSQQSQSGLLNGGSLAGGYSLGGQGGQSDGYQTGFMPTVQQGSNYDASGVQLAWKLPNSNQNDATTNAQGIVGGPQNTNAMQTANAQGIVGGPQNTNSLIMSQGGGMGSTTNLQGVVGGPQNTNTQVLALQGQNLGADGKLMMGATPQQPLLTMGGNTSPFSSLSDLGKSIPQQGDVGQQAPLAQLGWPTMNTLSF